MTWLALATWGAVGVLVFGSSAVFVWFLFDAGKILHGPRPGEEGADEGTEEHR